MNKIKIISVVGARPNFIKVAPIYKVFETSKNIIEHKICHTGQHYDIKMSKVFFEDLGLPEPDFYLGIGSASHAQQTAKIMVEFEKVLINERPDVVLVVGDVNSTIACGLTAVKMGIKLIHVEAGLRSFDKSMPEEINRILTDSISDILFVSEPSGLINLKKEGVSEDRIFYAGNVMIDSLVNLLPKISESKIKEKIGVDEEPYILVTLHRPSNVDVKKQLMSLAAMLNRLADKCKILFPLHPRTKKRLEEFHLEDFNRNVILTEPLGYIEFMKLIKDSEFVITDSGGIQEETTFLGVQCITLRDTTERPVTLTVGTNQLLGLNLELAERTALKVLSGEIKKGEIPELWDGRTAERITKIIISKLIN